MQPDAIPTELKERRQWVVWAYEKRDGKQTKVPYVARAPLDRASSGRKWRASSTDPSTWRSYEEASAIEGFDGIGFVFSPDDPLTGVDLDGCIDGAGNLDPAAKQIVDQLHTYTELSPSGTGLHLIARAKLNATRHSTADTPWNDKFEVYSQDRFFTITANATTPWGIESHQEALDKVTEFIFGRNGVTPPSAPDPLPRVELDDEELLRRAGTFRNGIEFERLYAGDHDHASASEADLALCNLLAFACGPDPDRIDRLFRRSGLMRPKWDERHGEQTYGAMTVAKALEGRTEFYGAGPKVANALATSSRSADEPFAHPLGDFVAERSELPPALIGDAEDVILPVGGFVILGGKGGRGKTTLAIDAAFHLASGREWLGFAVERALRVLLIENEGSREMFRRKLEAKREAWPHEIPGEVFVHTADWGGFDLRAPEARDGLREFVTENGVDVVFGDPLDSCGLEGVGSPEDTRAFMELAKAAGLHRDVAFWFLHHPKKDRVEDELDSLSGAWGGRPDTVFTLNILKDNRSRLGIPKTRWGKVGKRAALILGFDQDAESFELLKEETEGRDYVEEIAELLAEEKWLTIPEIAVPVERGGIGAKRTKVEEALEDERFIQREGAEVGRSSKAHATVWGLA